MTTFGGPAYINGGVFNHVGQNQINNQYGPGSPGMRPNETPSPSNNIMMVGQQDPASKLPVSLQPSQHLPISPAPLHAEPTSQPAAAKKDAQYSLPPALASAMANPKEDPKKNDSKQGPNVLDNVLDISGFVLNQIKTTAGLISVVPFLGTAATIALSIVTNIQGARDNKGGFAQLAQESCGLVYVVIKIYDAQQKNGIEMPEDLNEDAGDLVSTLREIEQFSEKMSQRKGFMACIARLWNNKDDAGKIQSYQKKITSALNFFWLESDIRIRSQLKAIADEQGAIHKDIREGNQMPRKYNMLPRDGRISIEHLAVLAGVDYSGIDWTIGRGTNNIMNISN